MAIPQIRFIFEGLPSGAGVQKIVFVRDQSIAESGANGGGDIDVHCDEALIMQRPSFEEHLEDISGTVTCSELQFKLLDTFQNGLVHTNANLGAKLANRSIASAPLARVGHLGNQEFVMNYSLYTLITEMNPGQFYNLGLTTLPSRLIVEWWINDRLKTKQVVKFEATNTDEEFLWGETTRGKYLLTSHHFYRYDAAEKVISIVGNDLNKDLLEAIDVTKGLNGTELTGSPSHGTGSNSRMLPGSFPVPFATPESWPGATEGTVLYDKFPLWDILFPDLNNTQSIAGWFSESVHYVAFSIQQMYHALYSRAFGSRGTGWDGTCDKSDWKFNCVGLKPGQFCQTWAGSTTTGYDPFLEARGQNWDPVNHKVTDNFYLMAPGGKSIDEIFLEYSWSADYQVERDKAYSFCNYKNGWGVATQTGASLGYFTRYSWQEGGSPKQPMTRVQHFFRTATPKLLTIPAFEIGGSKASPHGLVADGVECSPAADYGNIVPWRRDTLGNTPVLVSAHGWAAGEFFGYAIWHNTAKLIEAAFDKTRYLLGWDDAAGYYQMSKLQILDNESSADPVAAPKLHGVYKNPFQWKPMFGIFGHLPLGYYGGATNGFNEEGFPTVTIDKPEFFYIPAGTNIEFAHVNMANTNGTTGGVSSNPLGAYVSAQPGLILLAGPSADHGMTIDTTGAGTRQYYRQCGSIEVPYGTGTVKSYSFLEASAIFMSQFKANYGEKRTLTLPTCTEFENELGETGMDSFYPGLGVILYKKPFLVTRTKIDTEADTSEMDAEELPQVLPQVYPSPAPPCMKLIKQEGSGGSERVWNISCDSVARLGQFGT